MEKINETLYNKVLKPTVSKINKVIKEALPGMMKIDLQAQVADQELWDVLRDKFEKFSALVDPYRTDAFCKRDHDDHQRDDAPPLKGKKREKRQKTTKISKSANESS
nr:hypothetical protein [Tanacetum cinerariifolium]